MAKRSSDPPLAAYDQGVSGVSDTPSLRASSKSGPTLAAYDVQAPKPSKGKKKGKKKSAGGLLGNLLSGAGHGITAAVPGLVGIGKAAIHDLPAMLEGKPFYDRNWQRKDSELNKIGDTISASYKQKYGPLAHGDVQGTWNEVYKDPFGTILDVAMLASSGVGGATKLEMLTPAAREIELASGAARAGREAGLVLPKSVRGSELSRRLKIQSDKLLKKLPPEMKVLGEQSRFNRAYKWQELKTTLNRKQGSFPYQKALADLPVHERVAANLMHDFPTVKDLDMEVARLRKVEGVPDVQLRTLTNLDVRAAFENPTAAMHKALDEGEGVGKRELVMNEEHPLTRGNKKLREVPVLTDEGATLRRFQPALIARGAHMIPDPVKVQAIAKRMGVAVEDVPPQFTKELRQVLEAPNGKTIPSMIGEIRADITAEGRREPVYRPQRTGVGMEGTKIGSGGKGTTAKPHQQNKALLQTFGYVAYDLDTLTPQYLRNVRWATYADRHSDLLRMADEVPPGTAVPRNLNTGKETHYWLKESPSQRMGNIERTGAQFEQRLEDIFPESDTALAGDATDLITNSIDEAFVDAKGNRYMIRKKTADAITGEYVRSNSVLKKFYDNTTAVWRALVLPLRVGWLTYNIVGNTMMYMIKEGGIQGLKSYFQVMTDLHGIGWARKALSDPEILKVLRPDDLLEVAGEQVAGTFLQSQLPDLAKVLPQTRLGRATAMAQRVITAPTKPLRWLDIKYEQKLRLAMFDSLLKKSPEFKARWNAMPKETRRYRAEATKAMESDPQLVARISDEVNDSLGNFLSLNATEQNVLRSAAPFYSWYREITKITMRLPLNMPIRTDLLYNIGQVGWADSVNAIGADGIEDYLRTFIRIGKPSNGRFRGISTQGPNPYMTVIQEAQAASNMARLAKAAYFGGASPSAYDAQNAAGMLNPLLGGLLGKAAGAKGSVFENLPQWRLGKALINGVENKPMANYDRATRLSEALQFLGAPYKDTNLNNARTNYYRYKGK